MEEKLKKVFKEINEAPTQSGTIDLEDIFIVQDEKDVDNYIFATYICSNDHPFPAAFFDKR